MKVAIMGAGAVGCYYGAMLALAGHQVVLVGRASFVEAVLQNGLILEKEGKRLRANVEASSEPSVVAGADLVMICVKSGDTEQAGREVAPYLSPTCIVLSLQNGVTNAETLASLFGRPVLPVVVYVASRMSGPGVVRHEGRGDLELSGHEGADVAAILTAAGIQTNLCDDVMKSLWVKLVVNCAINPLSAITRLPYGKMVEQPGVPELMEDIAREALEVAKAQGICVPDSVFEIIRTIPVTMSGQYSSTAQDLMNGKPTEIDFLNGEVVRLASIHGIAVPINRTMTLLVKSAERVNADKPGHESVTLNLQRIAAFSSEQEGGNPAGVVICEKMPGAEVMQALAAKVGYSETVFAAPVKDGWRVRYFAPEVEVDFCGHATIALGAALARSEGPGLFALKLNHAEITVEGYLSDKEWGASFQSPPTHSGPVKARVVDEALELFGLTSADLDMRIPPAIAHGGCDHLVLALKNRKTLSDMSYDLEKGQAFASKEGFITLNLVHAESDQVFHARNPFPFAGVYEDPATGAAAAALAGYLRDLDWSHHGSIVIQQGHDMGVPSRLQVQITSEPGASIRVSGAACFIREPQTA